MIALVLFACGPRSAVYEDPADLPFPVATIESSEPGLLWSVPVGLSGWRKHFGVPSGMWWVTSVTEGWTAELTRTGPQLPLFRHIREPGAPVETIPLPPFLQGLSPEAANEVMERFAAAEARTAFDPDGLAFQFEDRTHLYAAGAWTDLPAGGTWAVFDDKVVDRDGTVTFADGRAADLAVGDEIEGADAGSSRTGPLRSDGVWKVWTSGLDTCAGIRGFDGILTEVGCLTGDFAVEPISAAGGTDERVAMLMGRVTQGITDYRWMTATEAGPAWMDWSAEAQTAVPRFDDGLDLPNDPRVWVGAGWLDPETAELVNVPSPKGAPVSPDCPTPGTTYEDRAEPWCRARTIPVAFEYPVPPATMWTLHVEDFDAETRAYALLQRNTVVAGPTQRPNTPPPVSTTGMLSLPDIPGVGPFPVECAELVDGTGDVVTPVDGVYELFFAETYTLRVLPCDLGDGGSPLIAFEQPVDPVVPATLTVSQVGRGFALDPADDPLVQRTDAEFGGLVVREVAGWMALDVEEGGLIRTPVGQPADPPPRILPGPRYLTASGELVDEDGTETLALDLAPDDVQLLSDRYLVQDSPTLLRVHDLSSRPATLLIDETGPRDRTLLAVSEDGEVVIEASPNGRTELRQRGTVDAVTEMGTYPPGTLYGDLSAQGSLAVTSSDSTQFLGQAVDIARIDAQNTVTTERLCEFCGPHAFVEDDGVYIVAQGQHLLDDDGAFTALSTTSFIPRVPVGDHRADAFGWVWFGSSALDATVSDSLVTVDAHTYFPSDSGSSWSMFAGSWYRTTAPGVRTLFTPPSFAVDVGDAVLPVSGPEAPEGFEQPCRVVRLDIGVPLTGVVDTRWACAP